DGQVEWAMTGAGEPTTLGIVEPLEGGKGKTEAEGAVPAAPGNAAPGSEQGLLVPGGPLAVPVPAPVVPVPAPIVPVPPIFPLPLPLPIFFPFPLPIVGVGVGVGVGGVGIGGPGGVGVAGPGVGGPFGGPGMVGGP